MRELPIYNGAMPQAAKQQVVQVGFTPKVEPQGEVVDRAIEQAAGVANKLIDLHDFSEGQKTELERRRIADEASDALQAKMSLTFDDPESLYRPDGQVDEDKLTAFVSEWTQKYHGVQASFWKTENALKDGYRQQDDADRLNRSIRTAVLGRELQNRRQYFNDNLQLALLKGDYDGAHRAVDDAGDGGMLTETQRKIEHLKIDQRAEKERLARQAEELKRNPLKAAQYSHEVMSSYVGQGGEKPAEVEMTGAATMGGGFAAGTGEKPGSVLRGDVKRVTFAANAAEREALMDRAEAAGAAGRLTLGENGSAFIELSGTPSEESVRAAARAEAAGSYTLEAHRRDVLQVAAGVMTNPNFAALGDDMRVKKAVQKAALHGGAEMFFGGSQEDYEGWLQVQAQSVVGLSGTVAEADRMLKGHAGQMGIEQMVLEEVTDAEIAAAWDENEKVTDENDEGRKKQEALYLKYKQAWINADKKADPDETLRVKDVRAFMKWYYGEGGMHEKRRKAFSNALRGVYRERAVDAVLHLRGTGRYELSNGQVVELDGKSDWAVERRVIRDALQAPVTKAEYGNMAALVKMQERLEASRQAKAKVYAEDAAAALERIGGQTAAVKQNEWAEDLNPSGERAFFEETLRADAEAEEKRREEAKKKEVATKKRLAGYSKKTEYAVRWDGEVHGDDAAAVVTVPLWMYAEAAKEVGAKGGLFVELPEADVAVPVRADEKADRVLFNRACMPLFGARTDFERSVLARDGAAALRFTSVPYVAK